MRRNNFKVHYTTSRERIITKVLHVQVGKNSMWRPQRRQIGHVKGLQIIGQEDYKLDDTEDVWIMNG